MFGTLLACVFTSIVIFYFYSRINPSFPTTAVQILRNAGFPNYKNDVHGANLSDTRLQVFLFYLTFTSVTSNTIIVACWVSKKQFIDDLTKQTQVSAVTKRMQGDFHRVFIALAICPLITNVFPTIFYFLSLGACESYPLLTLICSLAFVVGPVLNPITALFFVRPYRRVVMHWLGFNRLVLLVV